jgi:hypothetical protein
MLPVDWPSHLDFGEIGGSLPHHRLLQIVISWIGAHSHLKVSWLHNILAGSGMRPVWLWMILSWIIILLLRSVQPPILFDVLVWLRSQCLRGAPIKSLSAREDVVTGCAHLGSRAETQVVKVDLLGFFLHLLMMHDLHYFCVRPKGVGVWCCRLVGWQLLVLGMDIRVLRSIAFALYSIHGTYS